MDFITPVMRLVQGDVFEAQTKDNKGQPLVVKTGANAGQPASRYFIAGAVAKNDPSWPAFEASLWAVARQGYPQYFDATGKCTHPRFTIKVMDGDGVDANGQDNKRKEGFAGHWIIKFSSSYPPKVIDGSNGQLITDPGRVKRGYYIRVAGNAVPNTGSDVPGLYVNHNAIELVGRGQEIVSGPNPVALFAAAGKPVFLPPGVSAVPLAPAASALPPPPGVSLPTPPAPIVPNHQFVQNVAQGLPTPPALPPTPPALPPTPPALPPTPPALPPTPPALPPTPPALPVYQMTAAAQGFTREQWHANGTTDEQLLAHGYMVRVN